MKLFLLCLAVGCLSADHGDHGTQHHDTDNKREISLLLQNTNGILESLNEILSGIPHFVSSLVNKLHPDTSQATPEFRTQACDCDYHPGGCTISHVPPAGKACHCTYKGAWTCGGEVRDCAQHDAHFCKNPDYNLQTCLQGGGDCDAYPERCDCNYHPGGCRIAVTSPSNTACKCIYKGAWTCGAKIVRCKDPNNEKCKNPDSSKESCLQGGGDCDAY
ncbi:uncharacterized protein LOC128648524 isoform X2 [Bombina bombina]|nr:uncharacterized protein LOC128648524 isoform X2 [Bombina bombina]XP_053557221.1 uncharacterized protein LOC128648524 isoform X2 [Bombina bombina]XP_053557222.1 uncharacterized protein LOC128648524 isoform X2 [Bombina bombina]